MTARTVAGAQERALAHLESFLERAQAGFAADARLHAAARALSAAYTGSDVVTAVEDDAAASIAYLAHFGPRAIAAVVHALASAGLERAPEICVDVGAGSGASALALAFAGARTITLYERSAPALATAQRLLAGLGVEIDARVAAVHVDDGAAERDGGDDGDGGDGTGDRSARGARDVAGARNASARDVERTPSKPARASRDVERAPQKPAHRIKPVKNAGLVLSAFAFGELGGDPRACFAALEKIAPGALHIVVDAGDRARSRRIQEARDALVVEGRRVIAPCPHADPCPALIRERDWCHTRIAKDLPAQLAQFARGVGRDDETMALSFLVVAPPAAARAVVPGAAADEAPRGVLVIGDVLKDKGRARLPVCGPGGLRFVQALKRDRAAYDALVQIERGARLPVALADRATGGAVSVDAADALS